MATSRRRLPDSSASDRFSSAAEYRDERSSGWLSPQFENALLTDKFWILMIISCAGLFAVVDYQYHDFPTPTNYSSSSWTDKEKSKVFVEDNARRFMEDLCQHGTRHTGSYTNEVLAMEAITSQIKNVQRQASNANSVEMDIQSPKGCFDLSFIGNFTTCYENVKNILVKLSPSKGSSASLLVNCHYDTAISSPGQYRSTEKSLLTTVTVHCLSSMYCMYLQMLGCSYSSTRLTNSTQRFTLPVNSPLLRQDYLCIAKSKSKLNRLINQLRSLGICNFTIWSVCTVADRCSCIFFQKWNEVASFKLTAQRGQLNWSYCGCFMTVLLTNPVCPSFCMELRLDSPYCVDDHCNHTLIFF